MKALTFAIQIQCRASANNCEAFAVDQCSSEKSDQNHDESIWRCHATNVDPENDVSISVQQAKLKFTQSFTKLRDTSWNFDELYGSRYEEIYPFVLQAAPNFSKC